MNFSIFLVFLASAVLLSAYEVKGDVMQERTRALMEALEIEPTIGRAMPDVSDGLFPAEFPVMDGYAVRHTRRLTLPESRMQAVDADGEVKAYIEVIYAESPKTAQQTLFRQLATTSTPLELLLKSHEIDADGPGDICIVGTSRRHASFVRGNVAVQIRSQEPDFNFRSLARILDAMILSALLSSDDPDARAVTLELIGGNGKFRDVPVVVAMLYDLDATVRQQALIALGNLGDESTLIVLDLWEKHASAADKARPARDKWIDDAMARYLGEARQAIQARLDASEP